MKLIKKGLPLMLALSMVFTLSISANATEFLLNNAQTKNADVGVSATIRGEVWHYMGYENGVVWFEPTVKTIVSSSKTMAQVTVSMECRYNDRLGCRSPLGWLLQTRYGIVTPAPPS